MIENSASGNANEKYLIFQLGDQYFATPLIDIREVIEYQPAKPIPHTSPYFKGVINIRGEIVGVLDLRERLNLPGVPSPMAQLVFETDNGTLAATVDRVHSVTVIPESSIERRTPQQASGETSTSDRGYFIGIGKIDDHLISLISLRRVLAPDQMPDLPTPRQP